MESSQPIKWLKDKKKKKNKKTRINICIEMYVYCKEMSVYTAYIYCTGPYVHYNV